VTGAVVRSGEEARELCGRQLVSLVRWVTVEENLLADGYTRFVEAGPGTVLTGLLKALSPQTSCTPAGKLEEIRAIA
jgi:[acyl-carrier-protein] S-malonyltransferase